MRDINDLLNDSSTESKHTPILMIHGKKDSVVDYNESVHLADILKKNGFTSHLEVVEGGHIISIPSSKLIKKFIKTGTVANLQSAL